MKMKTIRQGAVACILTMLMGLTPTAYADGKGSEVIEQGNRIEIKDTSAYLKGLELILETGDAETITLPDDDSYLKSPEVKFVNAEHKNSIKSYLKPWRNQSELGAYPYHGMKVLVIAKQNEYDCIVFKDHNNELQAVWVHDDELTCNYPGEERTVGIPCVKYADNIGDVEVSWSEKSFDGSRQKYTILSEPAVNCVQFTLDYQVIGRGRAGVVDILGDRIIYVSDGSEWKEIGRFPYNEIDAVHVVVNLEEPMNITAVATIAECKKPDAFLFRQGILDAMGMNSAAPNQGENVQLWPVVEKCGDSVVGVLDSTGLLTITGTGKMYDYGSDLTFIFGSSLFDETSPWDHRYDIENVIIEDGVTSIGSHMFEYCIFESVTIPESVTSIGESAFNCTCLTSVTIPESVTSIGESAFSHCSKLTSVTIPSNAVSIGDWAFYNTGLTSVTIPEGVISIGEYAFCECDDLTRVTISDHVSSVGNCAFSDCPKLADEDGFVIVGGVLYDYYGENTDVIIPSSVTCISGEVFRGFGDLTSVTIPSSLRSIGDNAFSGCSKLADEEGFVIVESVLFGYYGKEAEVIIPASVTCIGYGVFSGNTNLTNVVIPEGVTIIGDSAFYGCTNLANVVIPENVTIIGNEAFYGCTNLTNVTIPGNVMIIGNEAFYGCTNLVSVIIPESVTSIGDEAFSDCVNLAYLTISENVMSIGYGAFSDCPELADADGFVIVGGVLFDYYGEKEEVIIPSTVLRTDSELRLGCDSVLIPESIKNIRDWMFYGWSNLENITISEGVKSIGDNAFAGLEYLKDVTIPESVESIGKRAFYGCFNLKNVTIPEGVKSIGFGSFSSCKSLTSVTIPESITRIEDYAFSSCVGLTNITLSSNITSIGYLAFAGCDSLTDVIFCGTEENWKNISINNTNHGNTALQVAKLHFKDADGEAYRNK